MRWSGNALTGLCVSELSHTRAEIVISESVKHINDFRMIRRGRGGKTYWDISIYDTDEMRFDQSSVIDFTVGPASIGEAKEAAEIILEWANCSFEMERGGQQ